MIHKPSNSTHKIAIIGAGISGLACATRLQNAGFNVTVFEKSKGVAGRMSTRMRDDWQCDHGTQYFTASNAQFAAEVQRWQQANVATIWHANLQTFDGKTLIPKPSINARYVGTPRQTSPAKWLAQSLTIQTENTINNIEFINHQWQLSTIEQGTLAQTFDILILAIPSVQAHALLKVPAPTLASIAANTKMQGCWTLMCRFNHALNCPFDGLFVDNNLLSWVARDSAKPGRNARNETWVLHASSDWSEAHLEDDADSIAAQMIAAFVALGGEEPQTYAAHRWRYADCKHYLSQAYVWEANLKVGLCGDWLNGGKVQGAWLSGHWLAEKMIATNS